MNWVALKMLTGDRAKYLGIVFGVSFAALLMGQQMAIFCGLMRNTTSQIRDIAGGDLWVMDRNVQFVDDVKPMTEGKLQVVRGVDGVEWAVRLYKGIGRARLSDGNFQQMILIGLDDGYLVGAPGPERMIHGDVSDLRRPDACIIDEFGWRYLFKDEPFAPGKTLEMNDKRAVIVGMCQCNPTFQTFPILYCTYSQAVKFVPQERKTLTFILAKPRPGVPAEDVCRRVAAQDADLKAQTNDQFFWTTINYYAERTGIPINFGITVMLGFVVGCAIAGQTFYLFTIENLKQFGALKAMGVSNLRLVGMILLQGLVVGLLGYGLGIGGAALFGVVFATFVKNSPPAFYLGWQIFAIAGGAVLVIVTLSALLSMRKVLFLEAGVVFPMTGPAVRLTGVTKSFGSGEARVVALADVSVEVPYGELVLLVGPSGCGKTTLISVVAGLLDATEGTVEVLGQNLTRMGGTRKVKFRGKNIGFVFQQYNLLPALTAVENAAVPLLIAGWSRTKATEKAAHLLAKVGLGGRLKSLPNQLSGGQQQRVAIARALVHDPKLLVCDEPTAALDAASGRTVMGLIREVAVQPDRAVVVVTHDNRVYDFGHRIVEMTDGRVDRVTSGDLVAAH